MKESNSMDNTEKIKNAKYLMHSWAKNSVRPTRNGEQIVKYISRANPEEIIAGYAYVRKYNGFPHVRNFHLLTDKITEDEIKQAHSFLEMQMEFDPEEIAHLQ